MKSVFLGFFGILFWFKPFWYTFLGLDHVEGLLQLPEFLIGILFGLGPF